MIQQPFVYSFYYPFFIPLVPFLTSVSCIIIYAVSLARYVDANPN